jgi:predicted nuclease of predicted toxin-antitoxin system
MICREIEAYFVLLFIWSSIGSPDAPDTGIMAYAQARGFVVLTNDLDS